MLNALLHAAAAAAIPQPAEPATLTEPGERAPYEGIYPMAWKPTCEVVVAEYGDPSGVVELAQRFASPHGCAVFAYSKSHSCAAIDEQQHEQEEWRRRDPSDGGGGVRVSCTELQNVGVEQHTFAYHVYHRYASLAERVYLVALPLNGSHTNPHGDHSDRLAALSEFMRVPPGAPPGLPQEASPGLPQGEPTTHGAPGASSSPAPPGGFPEGFQCICLHEPLSANGGYRAACPQEHVSDVANFQISSYKHESLAPATPQPLGAWTTALLSLSASSFNRTPVCYEGVAATTRRLIHARPRETYEAIERALAVHKYTEAAHYMERLMFAAYGGAGGGLDAQPESRSNKGKALEWVETQRLADRERRIAASDRFDPFY